MTRRKVLDLSTVREMLAYMHDDLRRTPGLERAAAALDTAIAEVERAERSAHSSARWTAHTGFLSARMRR
jgi:hypothetical protein